MRTLDSEVPVDTIREDLADFFQTLQPALKLRIVGKLGHFRREDLKALVLDQSDNGTGVGPGKTGPPDS